MGFSSHARSQTNRDNLYAKSIKRRGSYFKLKAAFLEATKKEGLYFKEAWPHQIKAIKEKLRAQKIEEKKQFYKAMIASVISGLILFFGISWMIRFVFF
ncbi:MAG: hypothetical protein QMC40_04830 [Vicingaceae bacterium]|jgi:ABC-type bacteriocin/lantibiotic exporter with double-glycine peptidase domain